VVFCDGCIDRINHVLHCGKAMGEHIGLLGGFWIAEWSAKTIQQSSPLTSAWTPQVLECRDDKDAELKAQQIAAQMGTIFK
jgi:hypothetical protein